MTSDRSPRRPLVTLLLAAVAVTGACAPSSAVAGSSRAEPALVVDGPTLRAAGSHEFRAAPQDPQATVRWRVDRVEEDSEGEDDGDAEDEGDERDEGDGPAVQEDEGLTARFDLEAADDTAATYVVTADDGRSTDTQQVQVLPTGTVSSFTHRGPDHPDVRTFAIVPPTLGADSHVLVVMHGTGRDAREYCETWTGWASTHDRVVLCPEFTDDDWPGSAGYNLGNVRTGGSGDGGEKGGGEDGGGEEGGSGRAAAGEPVDEARWSFTVVEDIHRAVDAALGLADDRFDLWGHSAGAQFVERFTLYRPDAPVRLAVAANAGWHTLPDPAVPVPYGLAGAGAAGADRWTRAPLVLMRGDRDTLRDGSLRVTPEADAQGPNRYERAGTAHRVATTLDPGTTWQLVDVPGAGHDQVAMAPAGGDLLLRSGPGYRCADGSAPCGG